MLSRVFLRKIIVSRRAKEHIIKFATSKIISVLIRMNALTRIALPSQ